MAILAELTSDAVLDTAYDWLCRRRRAYPADADVWSLRQGWAREKDRLKATLAAGCFRFGLLTRITLKDGEEIDLWSARDALVLKALAIVLAKHLPVSTRCTHVKGHGGAKAAVRQVMRHLPANRVVSRDDSRLILSGQDGEVPLCSRPTPHAFRSGFAPRSFPDWPGTVADLNWQIVGTGDFNTNGKSDILWRHQMGL